MIRKYSPNAYYHTVLHAPVVDLDANLFRQRSYRFNFAKIHFLGIPSFSGTFGKDIAGGWPPFVRMRSKLGGQIHGTFETNVGAMFTDTPLFTMPYDEDRRFAPLRWFHVFARGWTGLVIAQAIALTNLHQIVHRSQTPILRFFFFSSSTTARGIGIVLVEKVCRLKGQRLCLPDPSDRPHRQGLVVRQIEFVVGWDHLEERNDDAQERHQDGRHRRTAQSVSSQSSAAAARGNGTGAGTITTTTPSSSSCCCRMAATVVVVVAPAQQGVSTPRRGVWWGRGRRRTS